MVGMNRKHFSKVLEDIRCNCWNEEKKCAVVCEMYTPCLLEEITWLQLDDFINDAVCSVQNINTSFYVIMSRHVIISREIVTLESL